MLDIVVLRIVAVNFTLHVGWVRFDILTRKDAGFHLTRCHWRKGPLSKLRVENFPLCKENGLAFRVHELAIWFVLGIWEVSLAFLQACVYVYVFFSVCIRLLRGKRTYPLHLSLLANYISIKVFSSWWLKGIKIFIIHDCMWKYTCA